MTKNVVAVLVLLFLPTNILFAQDDVAKELIQTLKDQVTELKEANKVLSGENGKLMEEIQTLKKEKQTLEAKIEELQSEHGGKPATAEKEKKIVAALGTKWKGRYTGKGGVGYDAEAEVVAREGKTMTLRTSAETGAIMEYECEFTTRDQYKIKNTRRIQASKGNANPPPVGGVNGRGKIYEDQNRLVQEFSMIRAGEPPYKQTFDLKLQN